MTLVLNEIHLVDGLRRTMIVSAADRLITNWKPDPDLGIPPFETQPKLFEIPYLRATISYFGLAWWWPDANRKRERGRIKMWDVIPAFITKQAGVAGDLRSFAFTLKAELESRIHADILKVERSGFHIAGYRTDGVPEFWFLTNIREMEGFDVKELGMDFKAPAPHFLERDMRDLGWDGMHPGSVSANGVATYRNGDIRAHGVLWDQLQKVFEHMWSFPDFEKVEGPDGQREITQFKFEVLGYLYRKFSARPNIGDDIDVVVWTSDTERGEIRRA